MAQEIKKADPGSPPVQRSTDPLAAMRAEFDRVFDSFLGRGFGRLPATFTGRGGAALIAPSIDIRETETELVVEAELPGLDEKDVTVTLANGVLTLKGEKKSERKEDKDDYHLTERSYGSFQRSFDVADTVDPENVAATFEKGVLTVRMGKRAKQSTTEKRIPIGQA